MVLLRYMKQICRLFDTYHINRSEMDSICGPEPNFVSQGLQTSLFIFKSKLICKNILSAATLVAADYGFTCLWRFMSAVVVGTNKNWNFSAVRSTIELKLGEDLGLACMFWFWDSNKQNKNAQIAKIAVLENLSFLRLSKSDWSETWWGHPDRY
jgi:hypothetical protein